MMFDIGHHIKGAAPMTLHIPNNPLTSITTADLARESAALLGIEIAADEDEDLAIAGSRRSTLEGIATWQPSGDAYGAKFHLALIKDCAENLRDLAGSGELPFASYFSLIRMLGSITAFIEASGGVRRDDIGLNRYMPDKIFAFARGETATPAA